MCICIETAGDEPEREEKQKRKESIKVTKLKNYPESARLVPKSQLHFSKFGFMCVKESRREREGERNREK